MTKIPDPPTYRHVCGHVDTLTPSEAADYVKNPAKFALDERVLDADGKPTQVLHCRNATCNRLAPLAEFTFLESGENLDPEFEEVEEEQEVEEAPGRKVKKKVTVRRKRR